MHDPRRKQSRNGSLAVVMTTLVSGKSNIRQVEGGRGEVAGLNVRSYMDYTTNLQQL